VEKEQTIKTEDNSPNARIDQLTNTSSIKEQDDNTLIVDKNGDEFYSRLIDGNDPSVELLPLDSITLNKDKS